jgi:hypothetical protein
MKLREYRNGDAGVACTIFNATYSKPSMIKSGLSTLSHMTNPFARYWLRVSIYWTLWGLWEEGSLCVSLSFAVFGSFYPFNLSWVQSVLCSVDKQFGPHPKFQIHLGFASYRRGVGAGREEKCSIKKGLWHPGTRYCRKHIRYSNVLLRPQEMT